MLKEISLDAKENFVPEQIQRFEDDSDFYKRFVKGIEKDTSGNFRVVRRAHTPGMYRDTRRILTIPPSR